MEKPLFEYRNYLRNGFIILVWVLLLSIGIGSIGLSFYLLELHPKWNPELDWIVFIMVPIITIVIPGWYIRLLRIKIYVDAIVFKEQGPHPIIEKEFGVAFCNITEYEVKSMILGLNWILIKRSNGKPVRKLASLSKNELPEFLNVLNDILKKTDT